MIEQNTQLLSLENRNELRINGVTQATSATESAVLIETTVGGMNIRGKKLHVEKLDTESGDFYLTGEINEIRYIAAKKPLLKRLFK